MAPHGSEEVDPPVPTVDAAALDVRLVTAVFDDSWSTLDEEVAIVDRLLGAEIAALFKRGE